MAWSAAQFQVWGGEDLDVMDEPATLAQLKKVRHFNADFITSDGTLTQFMNHAVADGLDERRFMAELSDLNDVFHRQWFKRAFLRTNISPAHFFCDPDCRNKYMKEILFRYPELGDQAEYLLDSVGDEYEDMEGFKVFGIQHLLICFEIAHEKDFDSVLPGRPSE
jgi:hypothetical protein